MCQRDEYITSLYLLSGSISFITSGIFILMSMGDVYKIDQLKQRNEIKHKDSNILPTSTLKVPQAGYRMKKSLVL